MKKELAKQRLEKHEHRRKRLDALIKKKYKGVIAHFADAIETAPDYVSRMLYEEGKKGKKGISDAMAAFIERVCDAPGWFQEDDEVFNKLMKTVKEGRPGEHLIPKFDTGGRMGASGLMLQGQHGSIENLRVDENWLRKNLKGYTSTKNLCIVTGFGESMKPLFNPGDPVIVDRAINKYIGEFPYFFRIGDEGFIKRLQRVPGEGYRVISDNKTYETWTVTPDMDFEIFGKVIKVWCSEDF